MNARTGLVLVWVAGFGCASSGTNPDDMSASEHRRRGSAAEGGAAHHDALHSGDPEGRSHLLQGRRLEHLAEEHRAAAAELERFESAECGSIEPATRSRCPLIGAVAAVEDIDGGALLRLGTDVDPRALLEHARCHVAFGRTQGREGMPHCPLYVRDIEVRATADGRAIEIVTTNAAATSEIRERSRAHVEQP